MDGVEDVSPTLAAVLGAHRQLPRDGYVAAAQSGGRARAHTGWQPVECFKICMYVYVESDADSDGGHAGHA